MDTESSASSADRYEAEEEPRFVQFASEPDQPGVFRFERRGRKNRSVVGEFVATGIVPRLVDELRDRDIQVPLTLFQKSSKGNADV